MDWLNIYTIILMIGMIISLVLTPICRIIALKTGFMDRPLVQDHKQHSDAIPLLGGAAICGSWIITIVFGFLSVKFMNINNLDSSVAKYVPGMHMITSKIIVICIGAVLAMLLGLYDDKFNMSAKVKFFGQFCIAALVTSWGGVRLSFFIPIPVICWFVTVFWILLIMNAINFFDNMDGLAVGTASIALCFFTVAAAANQQYFVASLCAATAGSAIGFWFYNHTPATIFMGDSGSHFLGYILAVMGALVTFYNPEVSTTRFPILIPLFILAIPLFDALAVVVIRYRIGKPFYIGDNNHISHRFVKMNMSRKKAVLMVHLLTLIIGLSVLPLLWGDEKTSVISILQALTILSMISILQFNSIKQEMN